METSQKYYWDIAKAAIKKMVGFGEKIEYIRSIIFATLGLLPFGTSELLEWATNHIALPFYFLVLIEWLKDSWISLTIGILFGWFFILCSRINYSFLQRTYPKLKIEFGEKIPRCKQKDKIRDPDFDEWLHRIKIINKGQKPAENISVKIEELEVLNEQTVVSSEISEIERCFNRYLQVTDRPRGTSQVTIKSDDSFEFFDLLSTSICIHEDLEDQLEGKIRITVADSNNGEFVPQKPYRISLCIYYDNTLYCRKSYKLINNMNN